MRKTLFIIVAAMMAAINLTAVSCADADEGETWDEWILRNTINGPERQIQQVETEKGKWVDAIEANIIYFAVKFSASNHNFRSTKWYYTADGETDPATKEQYTADDNTAFSIKDNVVECTVDGQPYFQMKVLETGYYMDCELYFYKEKRKFHVKM